MSDSVRVLLDEGVPESLRLEFAEEFHVETVRYRRWRGLKNGDLLRAAENAFDVLVTIDKRLRFQQNLAVRSIAVIVLDANGTTFDDLLPFFLLLRLQYDGHSPARS